MLLLVVNESSFWTTLLLPVFATQLSVSNFNFMIIFKACVHAKALQSCLTLCNPMDCSPPGFSIQGFTRQEYWSGLPCPPPGDLPDPVIEPVSLYICCSGQSGSLPLALPGKPYDYHWGHIYDLLRGLI